ERADQDAEATAMMRSLVAEHRTEVVRRAIREQVLPVGLETLRRVERAECRRRVAWLEAEHAALQQPWFGWAKLAVLLLVPPLLTLAAGSAWAWCADRFGVDPFFGGHADILCPRT